MEAGILLGRQIVVLFMVGVIGFVLTRSRVFKKEDATVFSKLTVYVLMPCLVLRAFQIEYTADKMKGLLLAFVASIIIHIVFILLCKVLQKLLHLDAVEQTSMIYTNSMNMLVPLILSVLGEQWVFYASAYLVVWTVLFWTHGKTVLDKREKATVKSILLTPNIIAIILGLILFLTRIKVPYIISEVVYQVADTIGVISMLVVGMLLGVVNIKILKNKRVYLICFLRLVVFPLLILLIMKLVGATSITSDAKGILLVVVLQMSAPVATVVTQLAQVCGQDSQYASIINVVSVFFCIITMPVMLVLYEMFL